MLSPHTPVSSTAILYFTAALHHLCIIFASFMHHFCIMPPSLFPSHICFFRYSRYPVIIHAEFLFQRERIQLLLHTLSVCSCSQLSAAHRKAIIAVCRMIFTNFPHFLHLKSNRLFQTIALNFLTILKIALNLSVISFLVTFLDKPMPYQLSIIYRVNNPIIPNTQS